MSNQIAENKFAPELDDGEMWLPSDIFLNEIGTATAVNSYRREDLRNFARMDMDSLSRYFSSLSLLCQASSNLKSHSRAPLHLERFKPPVLRPGGSPVPSHVFRLSDGGVAADQRMYECRTNPLMRVNEPVYKLQMPKPIQTEVETYLHLARTRTLPKQQDRLPNQISTLNRNTGSRVAGLPRGSCGTGVFHPRINAGYAQPNCSIPNFGSVKKHAVRNGQLQGIQATQQRSSAQRIVGLSHHDDCYYHLPSDFGFPRDWT